MICGDFLAGANLDNGDPETLLFSMTRFFHLSPEEQKQFIAATSLKGTGYAGKGSVRIAANQANRAHDQNKNYSQHDCVFSDILALFVPPESEK